MRSAIRFLVVGAIIIWGLLLDGIQPADASVMDAQGEYVGYIKIKTHLRTHKQYSDQASGNIVFDDAMGWQGKGTLRSRIEYKVLEGQTPDFSSAKYGNIIIDNIAVDIAEAGDINATGTNGNCHESTEIQAAGNFKSKVTNFNNPLAGFTVPLTWAGINYKSKEGSVKGALSSCPKSKKDLILQETPIIEKATMTIDQVKFSVDSSAYWSFGGSCSFPTWENSEHIRETCLWKAFVKGKGEWENE